MSVHEPLKEFFLHEIHSEEREDFPRLSRIPDTHVMQKLWHYRSLGKDDRQAFLDYCAHRAAAGYSFVVGAPAADHKDHPFFERWSRDPWFQSRRQPSVPGLRATVSQYKMDALRGVTSRVSKERFEYALSIRSVKAPELRKRARLALKSIGYYKKDEFEYYCCRLEGREFFVELDYGGHYAQLRYCVAMPEFTTRHRLSQFGFERIMGFGFGDWDFIVEENVDEAMALFPDLIRYCVALPERIRAAVA